MRTLTHSALFLILSFILSFSAYTGFTETQNASGKTGHTGAPGEPTCASCHSPGTGGSGSLTITGDVGVNGYIPGQTYNMSVTINHSGSSKFGFNLVALDSTNASIGTLTAGTGSQALNGPSSRRNLTHTSSGTATSTPGTKTFNFTWTAPTTYSGTVTFYAAGNATNGNGSDSGDFVYTGNLSINGTITTSSESLLNESLRIFPNPVTSGNAFALHSPLFPATLECMDLQGRILSRTEILNNETMVPTQNLLPGTYILRLKTDNQMVLHKLSVQP